MGPDHLPNPSVQRIMTSNHRAKMRRMAPVHCLYTTRPFVVDHERTTGCSTSCNKNNASSDGDDDAIAMRMLFELEPSSGPIAILLAELPPTTKQITTLSGEKIDINLQLSTTAAVP